MKNIFYYSLIFLLAACSQQQQSNISGTIEGLPEGKIALVERVKRSYEPIKTTSVKNEKFSFSFADVAQKMYYIEINDSTLIPFFGDKSKINITGNINNIDDVKITGSKTHDDYTSIEKLFDPINKQLDDIEKDFEIAEKEENKALIILLNEQWVEKATEKVDIILDYLHNNPKSVLPAYYIQKYGYLFSLDENIDVLETLDPSLSNSEYVAFLREYVEKLTRVDIGRPLLDFSQNDINGKSVSLSSLQKDYLLLEFWASW